MKCPMCSKNMDPDRSSRVSKIDRSAATIIIEQAELVGYSHCYLRYRLDTKEWFDLTQFEQTSTQTPNSFGFSLQPVKIDDIDAHVKLRKRLWNLKAFL